MSSSPVVGKIRVLILDEGHANAARLQEALRHEAMQLTILAGGVDAAIKEAKELTPEVILLVAGRGSPAEAVRRLDAALATCPIVALLPPEHLPAAREVLMAGARAYLPTDAGRDDLVDTITGVLDRERRHRAALARRLGVAGDEGRIIAVHGVKGGVGATTIAVNLAVAVRIATRARVALVDANLYSGDVAVSLNLTARSSLADLTPHLKELDLDFLGRASVEHASGVRAFLAPDDFERAQGVTGEQIGRILKVMQLHYDYIVVDTCSLPDQVTSAALDAADRIVMVLTPEMAALKNAARFLTLAEAIGYGNEKLVPLLNRSNSRSAIGASEIAEHLRLRVAITLPSEGATVVGAANAGEPVVGRRRGRFAYGIWQLTALLTGAQVRQLRHARGVTLATATDNQAAEARPTRSGLLGRLGFGNR